MAFVVAPLSAAHDRQNFACGTDALDRYLREQAGQDVRRRVAQCYVVHEEGASRIAGFYTLSAGDIAVSELPPEIARKLPRYPVLPVARLGRLAVDAAFKGQGLGSALLFDAADRVLRAGLGIYALAVDAKDERAIAFYQHFGFISFASRPRQLFKPLTRQGGGIGHFTL
jgi:GNAT superfamily N-acetyltransferase